MFAAAAAIAVAGIAGVAIAIAAGSPSVVVGDSKYAVAVKAKATPMAPPLIRRAPKSEAVVRSARRSGAVIDVAMKSLVADAALLLRVREDRVDPVGGECPERAFVRNAASFWWLPFGASSRSK